MKIKELIEKLNNLDGELELISFDSVQDMGANRPVMSKCIVIENHIHTFYTPEHTIERTPYTTIRFADYTNISNDHNPLKPKPREQHKMP